MPKKNRDSTIIVVEEGTGDRIETRLVMPDSRELIDIEDAMNFLNGDDEKNTEVSQDASPHGTGSR